MPTFKTKEKIKSTEINVEPFETATFLVKPAYNNEGKHSVNIFSDSYRGEELQTGESKPFTLDENTVILDHCKEAYSNLIKNVEKFVEENET